VLPRTQELFGIRWCEAGAFAYEDAYGRGRSMDFSGRILLPIHDLDGTVCNFVGRDATGEAEIRYLFPPTLPGAGRFLYGGHLAGGRAHLVIGEGPFDAIAIHQAIADHPDFRDAAAVGTFGISLGHVDPAGDDQLGRIRRLQAGGLKRVTFLWDGEREALRQALKAAEVVSRGVQGLEVHVGLLPKGSDPAELDSRLVREAIARAGRWSLQMTARLTLSSPY